jgi:hypothetical protein
MTKRTFAPTEWFHLTELSHAAVLSGLLAARRWTGGELKFQGGTSLHLVYGSPRFSEDLDFVTATTKGLQGAMRAAAPHVEAAFRREFPKLTATVKVRDEEGVPYPRNPRLFTLTLSEPDWFQSLKVKVEFFIIPEQICAEYEAAVRPFAPLWPNLRVDLPQVNIETASMMEILCDKLHALGDRARLKERDVFDLWWICAQTGLTARQAAEQFGLRYEHHVAMYPNGKRLPDLAVSLRERAASLVGNATTDHQLRAGITGDRTLAATRQRPPEHPGERDKHQGNDSAGGAVRRGDRQRHRRNLRTAWGQSLRG